MTLSIVRLETCQSPSKWCSDNLNPRGMRPTVHKLSSHPHSSCLSVFFWAPWGWGSQNCSSRRHDVCCQRRTAWGSLHHSLRTAFQPRSTPPRQKCPTLMRPSGASSLCCFPEDAGKDSDKCSLSQTEFLTFMNTELAAFAKHQKHPSVPTCMVKKLDINCDGQLDFQEFLNLTGSWVGASMTPSPVPRSGSEEPLQLASRPPLPSDHLLTDHQYPEPSAPITPCSHSCWQKKNTIIF